MPWKFRQPREKKRRYSRLIFRAVLIALLCAVVAGLPYAWSRYQQWGERRRLGRAQASLMRGDFRQALLDARSVQHSDPLSPAATEIIKHASEALQAPEALSWRRMQSAMEDGDADHLLGLADAFVKAADFASADRVLKKVKPADRDQARFHVLAARVAAKKGDAEAATTHWTHAARLTPEEDEPRLALAALQFATGSEEGRAEALRTIAAVKEKPRGRQAALRTLLADAQRRSDRAETREFAAELAASPDAAFADKLSLLASLHALRPKRDEEFSAYLAELQTAAAADAQAVFELMGWMVDNDLALVVLEWADRLSPELTDALPVSAGIAAANVRSSDWKNLRARVEPAAWGDMDFLRLAFLSLALERQGERSAATATWESALKAAEARPELLERLARVTGLWGWKERTEQVLWKLGPSEWCPRWVMDYLWAAAMARGDTPKLYEVSKLRLKMQPDSAATRNNHLNLALLTGQGSATTVQLAEALFKENPSNVFIASTYGFALYQEGKAKAAASIMQEFKPEQLSDPAVAQYYGIFLAAAGQTERAGEYLQLGTKAKQLPEEKSLVEFFGAVCRTRSLATTGDDSAAQTAWNEAIALAGSDPDRLERLCRMALDWDWPHRAETPLLKLAAFDRCPAWAAESLWSAVLKSGDAAQIYRASRLIAKSKPDDVDARTNFITLALLGNHEKDVPFQVVESHYQQNPDRPEVAAAYGLALCQQGKPEEAIALMAALNPAQLQEPRTALYHGFILAAAGRSDEAQAQLKIGAPAVQFPAERTLLNVAQLAFEASKLDRSGDGKAADAAWNQAIAAADGRADWLEMLAKSAVKSGPPRHAEAALWKLSKEENCPHWAVDTLWETVRTHGTSDDRYKASKLVTKANPKNLTARRNSIILALLTGQAADAPQRQAEEFHKINISEPDAIVPQGLSLYLQNRGDEAIKLMAALSPEQLREPRTALYYGIFLASSETPAMALGYLRAGAGSQMFPEERALLERVATADPFKPVLKDLPPQ